MRSAPLASNGSSACGCAAPFPILSRHAPLTVEGHWRLAAPILQSCFRCASRRWPSMGHRPFSSAAVPSASLVLHAVPPNARVQGGIFRRNLPHRCASRRWPAMASGRWRHIHIWCIPISYFLRYAPAEHTGVFPGAVATRAASVALRAARRAFDSSQSSALVPPLVRVGSSLPLVAPLARHSHRRWYRHASPSFPVAAGRAFGSL